MSDIAVNHKIKALELAVQAAGTPTAADTVARATAYYAFLAGTVAPAAGATTGAAGANKNPATGANTTKPGAGTSPAKTAAEKAAEKAADKIAADKAAAKANKGAAGATAGAKTPAAGGATGAPVAPDTKAPNGKHTYADVVEALRKVRDKSSKDDAVAILVEDGGGAKSVRDLKPALYDAVVEACENTLNADGAGDASGPVEDGTEQAPRDELGL